MLMMRIGVGSIGDLVPGASNSGTLSREGGICMRLVAAFIDEEAGATAIEYALIASLIMLVIIGSVTLFATNVTAMWTTIASHI